MFNFLSLNFLLCKIDIIMTMSWLEMNKLNNFHERCRVQSKNSVLVANMVGWLLFAHAILCFAHYSFTHFTWIICALYLNLFPISVILFSRKISLKTMTPRNVIFLSQNQETTDKKKIKTNYGLQTHLASYLFFYSLWNKSFSTISWKRMHCMRIVC